MGLSKYKIFFIVSCLLLILVFVLLFIGKESEEEMHLLYAHEVTINNVELSDKSLCITGTLLSSGKSFREYTYEIEDNTLYISIYGGVVNKKHPSSKFSIDIQDDLADITDIYLSDIEQRKLLYP